MRDCMKKAAFKQAWQIIQGEGYYSKGIQKFYFAYKEPFKTVTYTTSALRGTFATLPLRKSPSSKG